MPRRYIVKVDGLSKERIKELLAFCRQYEEKKRKYNDLYTSSCAAFEISVMGGTPGNPTERKGIEAYILSRDIKIIEGSLKEATKDCPGLEAALFKNVTKGIGYERLGIVPSDKKQFYKLRRKFLCILDSGKDASSIL